MALIYTGAGVALILKGDDESNILQPSYFGWLFVIYGVYRILSRLLRKQ